MAGPPTVASRRTAGQRECKLDQARRPISCPLDVEAMLALISARVVRTDRPVPRRRSRWRVSVTPRRWRETYGHGTGCDRGSRCRTRRPRCGRRLGKLVQAGSLTRQRPTGVGDCAPERGECVTDRPARGTKAVKSDVLTASRAPCAIARSARESRSARQIRAAGSGMAAVRSG